MRFRIDPGKDGQFYVKIIADNNKIWFVSEGYTRKEDAERSVNDFKSEITNSIEIAVDGPQEFDSVAILHIPLMEE